MATVRVTNELKYGVRTEIRSMFDKLLVEIKNKIRLHSDSFYEALIPAEYRRIMSQLPDGYFEKTREPTIFLKNGHFSLPVNASFSEYKSFPRCYSSSSDMRTIDLNDSVNAQLAQNLLPLLNEYEIVEQRCKALLEQADNLMRDNGTVGMIVKIWPQFVELLPTWAKQKHFEVAEKRTRTVTALDEETVAALNSSLMVGKLSG